MILQIKARSIKLSTRRFLPLGASTLVCAITLLAYLTPCHELSKAAANDLSTKEITSNAARSKPDHAAEKVLKPDELRLDINEDALAGMQDFAYFAAGHFGDKTQYMGKFPDEYGGAYAVHCRARKPFCIEVKYPAAGVARESAMKIMQRLLPKNVGKVIEHDDDDLVKKDTPQPAEFFYFQNGPRTELLYAHGSFNRVIQINVWTKDG